MKRDKWIEMISFTGKKIESQNVSANGDLGVFVACVTGFLSGVYSFVLCGWVEHEKECKCYVKATAQALLSFFVNNFPSEHFVERINRVWECKLEEFDYERFTILFKDFFYDFGSFVRVYLENNSDYLNRQKRLEDSFVDFMEIASMFMTQEEFYKLVMEEEEEKNEVC